MALNGVIIYNQYNGANELLDDLEFNNTDEYNGYPTPNTGGYHYHKEPLWLTSSDKSVLVGYLLDGFPIYGPEDESGNRLATADLDDYHGHTSATAEYPDGIYHYHCTDDAPWINGGEYMVRRVRLRNKNYGLLITKWLLLTRPFESNERAHYQMDLCPFLLIITVFRASFL